MGTRTQVFNAVVNSVLAKGTYAARMNRQTHLQILSLAALCAAPISAFAQDWNVRPWDSRITAAWVKENIVGKAITFIDGGTARYDADGAYAYVYNGGRTFNGTFEVADQGAICVTFESGSTRCDLFVLQGDNLMLITEEGGRYPQVD